MNDRNVDFDELEKIFDYYHDGYQCAQVMLLYALEALEKEDPDLIRAAGGLNSGISEYRSVCGCLSGGACLLSYFAGKGSAQETVHPEYKEMAAELYDWFREFNEDTGGSVICTDLLGNDFTQRARVCPILISHTLQKCLEILERRGLI
ncbi:MAG: C_GCAxxG_C_C family protein [Solobacterium sp.]|nr:C_GCAxxG_C_C family protein [Solobacterium sp.]